MLEDLEKSIRLNDVESFHHLLEELVRLLQDDNTTGERPAANKALCYAAWAGSIPVMDNLIQNGVGKEINSSIYIVFVNTYK